MADTPNFQERGSLSEGSDGVVVAPMNLLASSEPPKPGGPPPAAHEQIVVLEEGQDAPAGKEIVRILAQGHRTIGIGANYVRTYTVSIRDAGVIDDNERLRRCLKREEQMGSESLARVRRLESAIAAHLNDPLCDSWTVSHLRESLTVRGIEL